MADDINVSFKRRASAIAVKQHKKASDEAAAEKAKRDDGARRSSRFQRMHREVIAPAMCDAELMLKDSGVSALATPDDMDGAIIHLSSISGTPGLRFEFTASGDLLVIRETRGDVARQTRNVPFEEVTVAFVKEEIIRFVERNSE